MRTRWGPKPSLGLRFDQTRKKAATHSSQRQEEEFCTSRQNRETLSTGPVLAIEVSILSRPHTAYNETMPKFLKPGKVALITRGRFAGKKVVIVTPVDNGNKAHPFPHAVVAGVERYPLKVTRSMSSKRMAKRSKVKPFIKVINYNHLMPTRYALELESLKGVISSDTFKEPSQREDAKKTIKQAFEERYSSGKNKCMSHFFSRLEQLLRKRNQIR